MLKYKAKKRARKRVLNREEGTESFSRAGQWRESQGYSWIARSLSLCRKPSTVTFMRIPEEKAEACLKKYCPHRALKPDEERGIEQTRRFWERVKQFYQEVETLPSYACSFCGMFVQVDAFQLVVESPTPFKYRNRDPDEEARLVEIENQRKGMKPFPATYSISDALRGVLHQIEEAKESAHTSPAHKISVPLTPKVSHYVAAEDNPFSMMRPKSMKSGSKTGPKSCLSVSWEDVRHKELKSLLEACDQSCTVDEIPFMEDILKKHFNIKKLRKIGEGAFGEAFKSENLVVKIVPFGNSKLVCGYPQKQAKDLLPEIMISQLLSNLRHGKDAENVCDGIAMTHDSKVCHGPYPTILIKEWYRWSESFGSENEPLDTFAKNQEYLLFFIEDGGFDLERFELKNYQEAKSILVQVAMNLAIAEEALKFEHRDLHWGNLLVCQTPTSTQQVRLKGQEIEYRTVGVKATLIDFSLSRIQSEQVTIYKDLSQDPEIFTGPSQNHQAETYRRMQKTVKGAWDGFFPETNCYWMQYLTETLLTLKNLSFSVKQKQDLRAFKRRCLRSISCTELIWDDFLKEEWNMK